MIIPSCLGRVISLGIFEAGKVLLEIRALIAQKIEVIEYFFLHPLHYGRFLGFYSWVIK